MALLENRRMAAALAEELGKSSASCGTGTLKLMLTHVRGRHERDGPASRSQPRRVHFAETDLRPPVVMMEVRPVISHEPKNGSKSGSSVHPYAATEWAKV